MRRPSARALAAATAATCAVASLLLAPARIADEPAGLRLETWVETACGGTGHCEQWQVVQHLSALLAERMELPEGERTRLATAIAAEAQLAQLDPLLVLAVIAVESRFDVDAVSHQGARGLMQLMPATLRREAERARLAAGDLTDPVLNVRAGTRYLRRLLEDFRQDQDLALMAYNAGPQRISRLRREEGGVPGYYREYARRVRQEHRRLRLVGKPRVALAEGQVPRLAVR
jgi:membrane-bound lytic murein transglycosylase MltF